MNTALSLYEETEFEKLMRIERENTFLLLKKELTLASKIIYESHSELMDDLSHINIFSLNRNSKPNRMAEKIRGKCFEYFGKNVKHLKYHRYGLNVKSTMLLFKKLDKNGRPQNIPTKNSLELMSLSKLPSFPGEPDLLYVGYEVNRSWDKVINIALVKMENNKAIWSHNLTDIVTESYTVGNKEISSDLQNEDYGIKIKNKTGINKANNS